MRIFICFVGMMLIVGCVGTGQKAMPTIPRPSATPSWDFIIPSPVLATPTPRPTVRPAITGLGYSLAEVVEVASARGFIVLRKDDRVRLEGGPVSAELFPSYDNLSKVWLDFDIIVADVFDVWDATALIVLFTKFETDDMGWFLQAFADGIHQPERIFGDVKMHVKRMDKGIIRITFTEAH